MAIASTLKFYYRWDSYAYILGSKFWPQVLNVGLRKEIKKLKLADNKSHREGDREREIVTEKDFVLTLINLFINIYLLF